MRMTWCVRCVVLAGLTLAGVQSADASEGKNRNPGPPPASPEAFQACSGIEEGASCSFTIEDRQFSGVCRTNPQDQTTVCAPEHPPRGGPPQEAFAACAGLEEGTACSFAFDGHTMDGTCRAGPDGSVFACGPNGPPPRQ